jgi:hypothetical protein
MITTRYLVLSAAIRLGNDFRLPPTGPLQRVGRLGKVASRLVPEPFLKPLRLGPAAGKARATHGSLQTIMERLHDQHSLTDESTPWLEIHPMALPIPR